LRLTVLGTFAVVVGSNDGSGDEKTMGGSVGGKGVGSWLVLVRTHDRVVIASPKQVQSSKRFLVFFIVFLPN
jgi:hypothetical protein